MSIRVTELENLGPFLVFFIFLCIKTKPTHITKTKQARKGAGGLGLHSFSELKSLDGCVRCLVNLYAHYKSRRKNSGNDRVAHVV